MEYKTIQSNKNNKNKKRENKQKYLIYGKLPKIELSIQEVMFLGYLKLILITRKNNSILKNQTFILESLLVIQGYEEHIH